MNPIALVAYFLLFGGVAFAFIFAALLVGRLVRARVPTPEKLEVYECGEPTIGPGFVQFDLRFYVVALLFIVFDVEAAFFFPWASVYGKAIQLSSPETIKVVAAEGPMLMLSPEAQQKLEDLGVPSPAPPAPSDTMAANQQAIEVSAGQLALASLADIAVFFGILLVGFAYLWKRGDLDWVRALGPSTGIAEPQEVAGAAR